MIPIRLIVHVADTLRYAQCLTNAACRPCREPNLTASLTIKPRAIACPAECDCTKIKDE